MVKWTAAFLSLAVVSALMGFGGIAAFATQIAWIALLFGVATAVVLVLFDRRSPLA